MNQILIEEINKNKRLMNLLEVDMVKLSDTSYPNVKHDNDATKNDSVSKALLDDIQKAAESVGVVATITTAKSGHKSNVKGTTVTSRHMKNIAVDIAILDGVNSGGATNSTNGNSEFRKLGNKLKNALVSLGYTWNKERGNDKAVLWQTNTGGNHYNHVHVSNKTGVSSNVDVDSDNSDSDETITTNIVSTSKEKLNNILNSNLNGSLIKDLIGVGSGESTSIEDLAKIFKTISIFT